MLSGIVAGGASVKTAQELARHSTPLLTIGRYSHARLHDLQGALDALPSTTPSEPDAQPQVMAATGTDDQTADFKVGANGAQLNGKSCENRPNVASGGETTRGAGRARSRETDEPQIVTLSAVGKEKATVANRGERECEKRRRSDSNRRWRICNPLP